MHDQANPLFEHVFEVTVAVPVASSKAGIEVLEFKAKAVLF